MCLSLVISSLLAPVTLPSQVLASFYFKPNTLRQSIETLGYGPYMPISKTTEKTIAITSAILTDATVIAAGFVWLEYAGRLTATFTWNVCGSVTYSNPASEGGLNTV